MRRGLTALRTVLRRAAKAAALPLLLVAASPAVAGDRSVVITIDAAERFQTISGWEATAELGGPPQMNGGPPWASAMIDRAVNTLGINRIRLELRSGSEGASRSWERLSAGEISSQEWRKFRYPTRNDNDNPRVIDEAGFDFSELDWRVETVVLPIRERLKARSETLYLNLCYVAFIDQVESPVYHHGDPDEYAEFILAAFLHLKRKYGITPDGVEVILEPDLVSAWNNGGRVAAAIEAASRRLSEHGFLPDFIAPSVTNMANAPGYIDAIMQNNVARASVTEFSYHRYQGASRERLEQIVERARRFGKRTGMLEYWLGNGKPEILHEDLKYGMNSAWQGRALSGHFEVRKEGDAYLLPLVDDAAKNRLYFNAARAGWVRVGAETTHQMFDPVAFASPDGAVSVVVQARSEGDVMIQSLPPGRYIWEMELNGLSLTSETIVGGSGTAALSFPKKGFGSLRPLD